MKNRWYVPVFLTMGFAAIVFLASSSPRWFAAAQDTTQPSQQPTTGPQPEVGETVIVPKKKSAPPPEQPSTNQPSPNQPNPDQPTTVQPPTKPEKINPDEIYTLSTSTNLVNVDVMVVDNNGNPIHTLVKNNFKVYDDGVPQAVTNFGTGEAPMTICLLVEFANRWWTFTYQALKYSYAFLDIMQDKDWFGVVSFDLKTEIVADFSQDKSQVRAGLDQLRVPQFSESNLYDSLNFVQDRMKEVHGRKAVIAVVTGIDTFSKLTYDQCLKIMRASDTPVYPISLLEYISLRVNAPNGGIPSGSAVNPWISAVDILQAENALKTIALYTGGQAYFPRFDQDVPGVYQEIANQLRMQYSLGFIPTNASKDGQFHKLKVAVVDEQGNPLEILNQKGKKVKYRIVARDGYYAPKS
jgi:Ca-activated chloride channel homolog